MQVTGQESADSAPCVPRMNTLGVTGRGSSGRSDQHPGGIWETGSFSLISEAIHLRKFHHVHHRNFNISMYILFSPFSQTYRHVVFLSWTLTFFLN